MQKIEPKEMVVLMLPGGFIREIEAPANVTGCELVIPTRTYIRLLPTTTYKKIMEDSKKSGIGLGDVRMIFKLYMPGKDKRKPVFKLSEVKQ